MEERKIIEVLILALEEERRKNALLEAMVVELRAENKKLRERVAELERRLGLNSKNSSKPPSSDGLSKPSVKNESRTKSLREKSACKPGGQPGRKGSTLKQVLTPDFVEHHDVDYCSACKADLKNIPITDFICRQVVDIPLQVSPFITEHKIAKKKCPQCKKNVLAPKAQEVHAPIQYGPGVRALATFLHVKQLIPIDRTVSVMKNLFQLDLSEGTIVSFLQKASNQLTSTIDAVKRTFTRDQGVKHLDESGFRIEGKTQWLHVISNEKLALYRAAEKRGDVPQNIEGIIVHDHFPSYQTQSSNTVEHAFCNAHHLRELKAVHEIDREPWAFKLIRLLKLGLAKTKSSSSIINEKWIQRFTNLYNSVIKIGLDYHENLTPLRKKGARGRVKRRIGHNLLLRLQKHKDGVLLFLKNPEVPFTNNRAESDLRMIKVKHKISGCFRSKNGAYNFLNIKSYIQSIQKQKLNTFQALVNLFAGNPTPLVGVPE